MNAKAEWLALTEEIPLEPALPICDAHHHFWNDGREADFLPADMVADIGGNNVVSSVFCEATWAYRQEGPEALKPVGETEAVAALPLPPGRRLAAALVGYADLRLGARVEAVLEAHLAASDRFRGVRFWSTWDENPAEVECRHVAPRGLLADPAFREGVAALGRHDLVFDAWMFFHQLPDLVALAQAFPDIPMVAGHFGGLIGVGRYADRKAWLPQWQRNIAALARDRKSTRLNSSHT